MATIDDLYNRERSILEGMGHLAHGIATGNDASEQRDTASYERSRQILEGVAHVAHGIENLNIETTAQGDATRRFLGAKIDALQRSNDRQGAGCWQGWLISAAIGLIIGLIVYYLFPTPTQKVDTFDAAGNILGQLEVIAAGWGIVAPGSGVIAALLSGALIPWTNWFKRGRRR